MASTFKPSEKVPYVLDFGAGNDGVVTGLTASSTDANVASVLPDPPAADGSVKTGFVLGNPNLATIGQATINWNGFNSSNQPVSGSILVTVDPGNPPPLGPVTGINVSLGDAVAQ